MKVKVRKIREIKVTDFKLIQSFSRIYSSSMKKRLFSFTFHRKNIIFREVNSLVSFSLPKLLSRNFCQKEGVLVFLTHFGKNFVKVTVLLNELLNNELI